MATLSDLYGHLKTLVEQWVYNKTQVNTRLDGGTEGNVTFAGKVDKESGKGLSSNDYTTTEKNKLAGIEAQANKITVDSALSSTSTNPLQNKAINSALSNKADSSSVPTKTSDLTNDGADGTNVFVANNDSRLTNARTPTSHTHGNLSNDGKVGSNANYFVTTTTSGAITSKQKIGNITTDGKIGTSANLPLITTTNGVVTTGSFGTTANTFCQGNDSRLSDSRNPTAHSHDDDDIDVEGGDFTNIASLLDIPTSYFTTQDKANYYIDQAFSQISGIKALEFVQTLPTASASTMSMLYVINENQKINFYWTYDRGESYNPRYLWEKMDTDILDELIVNWSDVQNKPSTFTPSSHTHGNLSDDGKIGSNANYFVYTTTSGAITSKQKIGNITTGGAIGSTANKPIITTTNGALTTGSFGTTANSFCEGNDSRLSDARTPTSHSHGNILNGGTCTTDVTFNSKILVTNSSNTIGTSTAIDVLDSVVQSLISYGTS